MNIEMQNKLSELDLAYSPDNYSGYPVSNEAFLGNGTIVVTAPRAVGSISNDGTFAKPYQLTGGICEYVANKTGCFMLAKRDIHELPDKDDGRHSMFKQVLNKLIRHGNVDTIINLYGFDDEDLALDAGKDIYADLSISVLCYKFDESRLSTLQNIRNRIQTFNNEFSVKQYPLVAYNYERNISTIYSHMKNVIVINFELNENLRKFNYVTERFINRLVDFINDIS